MEAINKQEKQLKTIKNKKKELIKRVEKEEKLGMIVLLRDNLNDILLDYGKMNIDQVDQLNIDELYQVILLLIIMIFSKDLVHCMIF